MLRALHQPRAQPRVAQPRPAELVTRPDRGVEPVASRQRRDARCGRREACVRHAGSKAYIYTALRVSAAACARSPRPRPQVSPTRTQLAARTLAPVCSVSSTNVLQQPGAITVQTLAVVAGPRGRPGPTGERPGCGTPMPGRTRNRHSPQHPVQVSAPAHIVPADPGVARLQAQRTRRKPDAAQPAMRRVHQIPQLRAHKRTGAAWMLVRHQRVPDPALCVGLHQHQPQVPQRADRVGHVHGRRHRVRQHARRTARHPPPERRHRRQQDMAGRLQVGQRRAATRALQPAAPITENRTLHRRGRRPARDCQRLARTAPFSTSRSRARSPRRLRPT